MSRPRVFDATTDWRRRLPQRARRANFFPWYGGKGRLAARVAAELPPARVYVEPYAGGGAVMLRRAPSPVEVLNDLDGDIANFYRVLRDQPRALLQRLSATPYARFAFVEALEARGIEAEPVARAAWFFVRQAQGFAGKAGTAGNWGRSFTSSAGMADRVSAWRGRIGAVMQLHARVSRAMIDNRDALEAIAYWDAPDALIYCDPPYVAETRREAVSYDCEVDGDHHHRLVAALLALQGAGALSCYDAPVYAPLAAAGWRRVEWSTVCYAAGRIRGGAARGRGGAARVQPRREVLYVSPRADDWRARP